MAIRRCPYCKAIIDEEDKYCNNCGTQLLFPEDEMIEEDIPGDRIVEDEEPGQEPEEDLIDEAAEESTDEVGDEEEEEFLEEAEEEFSLGEELEEAEESAEEEAEGEEVEISQEEREVSGWPLEEESAEEGEEGLSEELEEAEAEREAEQQKEEFEEEEIEHPPSDRFAKDEQEKKYEISIEKDELVLKTKDLDRLTSSVDEGGRDKKPTTGTKEDLPPWASGMKEIPSSSIQGEESESEEASTRREWTTDSGIGLPEKVTQKTLPFSDTSARPVEEERVEEEAEKPESEERPHALSSRLKAKLVDVVFITALWLISLWFTAQVIGVSFFRLIFGSLVPVLVFYLILLILYFFLFLYFLGETLGDHYFSEED